MSSRSRDEASRSTVRPKGQVTIPQEIRARAHLAEGDPVEFEIVDEGILLRPLKTIDATQAWFWTTSWQEGEAAASADIAAGRVEIFDSAEDFLSTLDD